MLIFAHDNLVGKRLQQLADACLFSVSLGLGVELRGSGEVSRFLHVSVAQSYLEDYALLYVVMFLGAPLVLEAQRYYDRRLLRARGPMLWALFKGCLLLSLGLVALRHLDHRALERGAIVWFWVLGFGLMVVKEELARLGRLALPPGARYRCRRFILVGAREELPAQRKLLEGAAEELEIVEQLPLEDTPVGRLVELLDERSAAGVIVKADRRNLAPVEAVLQACELEGAEVWLVEDFFWPRISRARVDALGGQPMLVFQSAAVASWQRLAKRALDCTLSLLLLLALWPLALVIAVLIKLGSPGPVFLRQERAGLKGRPFTMYKFRTTASDAEQLGKESAAPDGMAQPAPQLSPDLRVTKVGRLLRKFRLDQLPELINVLRGQMSLVGPRPLPLGELNRLEDLPQRRRSSVRPGLACPRQMNGRSELKDPRELMRLDLEYIDRWSLWLDLEILAQMVPAVLPRRRREVGLALCLLGAGVVALLLLALLWPGHPGRSTTIALSGSPGAVVTGHWAADGVSNAFRAVLPTNIVSSARHLSFELARPSGSGTIEAQLALQPADLGLMPITSEYGLRGECCREAGQEQALLRSLALRAPATGRTDSRSAWPQLRGPAGDGTATALNVPLRWSETNHIGWKAPVHGCGYSSPVLLGDRIWLTTAAPRGVRKIYDEQELQVAEHVSVWALCLDRASGQVLWQALLFDLDKPDPVSVFNSWATPTPVVEPGRLYCDFGTFGTACLDADAGQLRWKRQFPVNHHLGPGSSPVLFQDLLVLTRDGRDAQYLVALDKNSGREVWRAQRPQFYAQNWGLKKCFSTPLLVRSAKGPQLISVGARWIISYDPRTGKEIWRAHHSNGYSIGSSPAFGHGLVFFSNGYDPQRQFCAVRTDGQGDVTDTHVAWRSSSFVPVMSSPVLTGDELYWASDDGVACCADARTGEMRWHYRLGSAFLASPLCAEGRLYFFDKRGKTTVVTAGKRFEKLAENPLTGPVIATPAIADGTMFLRTESCLYRIDSPSGLAESR